MPKCAMVARPLFEADRISLADLLLGFMALGFRGLCCFMLSYFSFGFRVSVDSKGLVWAVLGLRLLELRV